MYSTAQYYCNSTFLLELDDRKFRNREKKKEIKYHILQQVHEMSVHYELHTLEDFLGSQLCQDGTNFCSTLCHCLHHQGHTWQATSYSWLKQHTARKDSIHCIYSETDSALFTQRGIKATPCIPRGTSFLFLPEPRLLSSSSSVLKTSFKSNFFFCFPGGGGGAAAAAFGVLGCCCAGEFQIFTTASTQSTYYYSTWREATPLIHTLQIYEDR